MKQTSCFTSVLNIEIIVGYIKKIELGFNSFVVNKLLDYKLNIEMYVR